MRVQFWYQIIFFLILIFTMSRTQGGDLPRWEMGLGLSYFVLPDYPGSNENRSLLLPFPYFFYRGDWIRADRDQGIRSLLFRNASVELNLSVGGALSVDSEANAARQGMSDIDWIYEFGPNLIYTFPRWGVLDVFFQLPLRFVGSTNLQHTQERGLLFNPRWLLRQRLSCRDFCFLSYLVGAEWAGRKLHDYLYSVRSEESRFDRPEYQARGGLLSTYVSLRYRHHWGKQRWGLGLSFNDWSQHANKASPLFRRNQAFSFSAFYARDLYESKSRVALPVDEI